MEFSLNSVQLWVTKVRILSTSSLKYFAKIMSEVLKIIRPEAHENACTEK